MTAKITRYAAPIPNGLAGSARPNGAIGNTIELYTKDNSEMSQLL